MNLHLWSIIPCFILGTIVLILKKGTLIHKRLGRIYMVLMLFTAIITLFLPALVGPTILGHFGWIHSFSIITLWSVPSSYYHIKKGNVQRHKWSMIFLYVGAIIIAGSLTFLPGRFLHHVFFG